MGKLMRRVQFGWLLARGVRAGEFNAGAAWRVWRGGDYRGGGDE